MSTRHLFVAMVLALVAACPIAWAQVLVDPVPSPSDVEADPTPLPELDPQDDPLAEPDAASILPRTQAKPKPDPTVADFYVSLDGNDDWSGTLADPNAEETDGPFASIEAARDALRSAKSKAEKPRSFRVLLRDGTYRITRAVTFNVNDSAMRESKVVYASYPGERAILSGGRVIDGWEKEADGPLWKTTIPEVRDGTWSFRQLFVDDKRATPARIANDEPLRTAGPGVPYTDRNAARQDPTTKISFHYQDDDLEPWDDLDEAVVVVYHSWTTSRHRIKSIDTDQKLVELTAPSGWPMGWWEKEQRYYVENIRAGLDAPGEWYLDHETGELFYYPREGEDLGELEVIAPVADELLVIHGMADSGRPVHGLQFCRLTFAHTRWRMPRAAVVDGQAAAFLRTAAIRANHVVGCKFAGCEIVHAGTYGLWLESGCRDNAICFCHFHDLGAGGIRIGQTMLPKQRSDRTERNVVGSCYLHDGGNVFHAGVGVWIGKSSYNWIHNNEISDFLYTGVSVGWTWGYADSEAHHNHIMHNHIHHLGWGELSDMGGVYTLGISPGTEVVHNHIHDVLSYNYGGWGLYTDEGSSCILLQDNVVHRVKDGAFHQHYGKNNIASNNILALSATYGQIRRSRQESHRSFTIDRNLIYGHDVPMLGGNWSDGNFLLSNNVYFDTAGREPVFPGDLSLEAWQEAGHDKGSIIADPTFADPLAGDFTLQKNSPACETGFVPINQSTIGLGGSQAWRDLPKKYPLPKMVLPGEE